jgi:hypothetical protein
VRDHPAATVDDAAAAGGGREPALTSVMTCLLACALGTGIVRAVGVEQANAAARAQPQNQLSILPGDFGSRNTLTGTAGTERDLTATLLILAGLLAVSLIAATAGTGHESAASSVHSRQVHAQQVHAQQDGDGRS